MKKQEAKDTPSDISKLYKSVYQIITEAKQRVAATVNAEATVLNFKVGHYIQTFILEENRAAYGKYIIIKLSESLTTAFGYGWSEKHLRHCLRCAETFTEAQIVSAVRRQLNWTHLKMKI